MNCLKNGHSDSEGDISEASKCRLKEGEVVHVHVQRAKVQLHTFSSSTLRGGKGQFHVGADFLPGEFRRVLNK